MTRKDVANFSPEDIGDPALLVAGRFHVALLNSKEPVFAHWDANGKLGLTDTQPRTPHSDLVFHDSGILQRANPGCQPKFDTGITLERVKGRLAANIRARRKAMGFSQARLAKEMKTTQTHVSEWESGKRDVHKYKNLPQLAKVLQTLEAVLDPEGDAYDPEAPRITEHTGANRATDPDAIKEDESTMTSAELTLVNMYRDLGMTARQRIEKIFAQEWAGRESKTEADASAPKRRMRR